MKNPCIYTLKDGTKLNYEQMRQYLFDNYADVVTGLPPAMPPPMGEGEGKRSNKAILNRLYDSDNISEAAKQKFREKDLKYDPQSKEEARRLAEGIVRTFGIDEAVTLAEARRFGGGVNSSIFAQALDILYAQEQATADASKRVIQETWADIAVRYDEWARGLGRDIAQIDDFYRRSPIGVALAIQKQRDKAFKEWFEGAQKPYKEVFDYLKTDPEFLKLANIGQQSTSKAQRAANRLIKRGKITEAFDKMKVNKGMTFATVIPPQVWNAAVELMKQATLAGESMVNVIEKGAEYIRNQVGRFDEDKFKAYMEKQLNQADESEKILDRIRKKLVGLTEQQKRDFVRKVAKQVIENGGLNYTEFQDLLAEAKGQSKLSQADIDQITGLVNDINAVEEAAETAMREKTPEAINAYNQALQKAQQSGMQLGNYFKGKVDVVRTIQSLMQLNTLTFVSLVKNISYNVWWQLGGRFATGLQMSIMDHAISGIAKIFGKNIPVSYTIANVQKEYFKKMAQGGATSLKQVVTGLTNKDYFQKELSESQIKPYESLKDIISAAKGDLKLTPIEVTDRVLKATFGVPAELTARMLNVGDKGFRFAAEGSQAEREAAQLGLKGIDKELFILFPSKMAQEVYERRGMSSEQAAAEAEALEQRIIREGEEAVFQQDNIISKLFQNIGKGLNDWDLMPESANKIRKLIGTASMPFVKTPVNVGFHLVALMNWEVSVAAAVLNAGSAYKKRKAGDPTWKNDFMQAKKWLATAGTGLGMMAAWSALQGIGALSGGGEKEEKEKERQVEKQYRQPRSINTTKIARVLAGGSPETKDGDLTVDVSWFGSLGMAMATMTNLRDKKRTEEQMTYLDDLASRLSYSSYEALEKGVFSTQAALTQAIMDRNSTFFEQYLSSLFNVGMNVIQPGTFAQISRAQVPYEYQIKADSFMERLDNTMAARSGLYRKLFDKYPPEAYTIWGDKAERSDPPIYRIFGTSKAKKDAFAYPLYEMYDQTGELGLFPGAVKKTITHEGQEVELNTEQHREFKRMIGEERKKLASAFFNDLGSIYEVDEDGNIKETRYSEVKTAYDKAKTEAQKKEVIKGLITKMQKIYTAGYEQGKANFMADSRFVKLFPTLDNEQKQIKKSVDEMNRADLKQMEKQEEDF